MKKRIIGMVMAMAVLFSVGGGIAGASGFSLMWANTQSVALSLSFSGSTATASSVIVGKSNTSSISATYTLKEKNANGTYSVKYTWPAVSVSGTILTFANKVTPSNVTITSGKTYRLYVTAVVTNTSGSAETVDDYLEKTYN
jgi:hypothetical protein